MRITQVSVLRSYLQNLGRLQEELVAQEQRLATGRRIERPSDDPVMLPTLLRIKQAKTETVRYQENAGHALDWLQAAESVLQDAVDVVGRVRELVLRGANATLDTSGREALYREWEVLRSQLLDLANTRHAGRYLFAGYRIDTAPFVRVGATVQYNGDAGQWLHEVDDNIQVSANLPGDEVFLSLLNLMEQLGPALQSGDPALGDTLLQDLDGELDKLLAAQAQLGARVNQLELLSERLLDREVALDELRSQLEDADLSRVIIRLKEAEAAYQAALQTGARLIRATLLDYL